MPVFACRRAVLAWYCVAVLGAQGCSAIPAHEFAEFTPLPKAQRSMEQVKLAWEVREDASEYCKQRQRNKGVLAEGQHVACAIWSVQRQECRIVTGPVVSHVVLGHEVRHCFEGHFHR